MIKVSFGGLPTFWALCFPPVLTYSVSLFTSLVLPGASMQGKPTLQPHDTGMWRCLRSGNVTHQRHSALETRLPLPTWRRAMTASFCFYLQLGSTFSPFQTHRAWSHLLQHLNQIQCTFAAMDTLVPCDFNAHHVWTPYVIAYMLY